MNNKGYKYMSRKEIDALNQPSYIADANNDKIWNCNQCITSCCDKSEPEFYNNCLKCQCQSAWQPLSGKKNKVIIAGTDDQGPLNCDCGDDSQKIKTNSSWCKRMTYLNNYLSDNGNTYVQDCSQINSISGIANKVNIKQDLICGSNTKDNIINNTIEGIKIPFGLNVNEAKIVVVVIVVLLLLLLLI
jgi:hypothetical protein